MCLRTSSRRQVAHYKVCVHVQDLEETVLGLYRQWQIQREWLSKVFAPAPGWAVQMMNLHWPSFQDVWQLLVVAAREVFFWAGRCPHGL